MPHFILCPVMLIFIDSICLIWMNPEFVCQVLAHLLDMVFYSDEKERVIPLLVNIMHYVVPYLRNHRWGDLHSDLNSFMFQPNTYRTTSSFQAEFY